MSLSDDAVERVVRSDTQHRAQLVRTIAQMLSSGVAIGDLWERCAPPMAELAGGDHISVVIRDEHGDRVVYETGVDVPMRAIAPDGMAARVLAAGETIADADAGTIGVPLRFGRELIGTIVISGVAADELVNVPLVESCALYAAARLHHESTLETTQRYERLALVDGLTGVANRRKFDDTFPREWARAMRDGRPLALLMMDVDFFKSFNDSYGHQAGDLCLQHVARALADCLQRPADLFARYGGEEFIALLPATDADGATAFAEKMRATLRDLAIVHEGSSLGYVTVSIGVVADLPAVGTTADDMLRAVDDALYRAKLGGRNRVAAGAYLSATPPAERIAAARPSNLPLATTKLIGRTEEIAIVTRLASDHRLVTILGAGGTGKTRLALRVAEAFPEPMLDGTWLVDLSALRDGALVASAIGGLFGATIPADDTGPAALARALQQKQLLLVLDNCEHLVEAVGACASALLHGCPAVRIIATSREPLLISEETVYRLPLLAVPPDDPELTAERAATFDAVALFVERAKVARRSFALTDENARDVALLVRRLDGIALAIELAAARLSGMSFASLATRLDARFRVLTSSKRDALDRHKTMRGALDWSFGLLEPNEQRLFRRLAIFAGPFTLDAASDVCMGEGIDPADVIDILAGLVRKSLVVDEAGGIDDRYVLLESMREYAREALIASGEDQRLAARHAAYFTTLAERAVANQFTTPWREWTTAAERDLQNDRAAFEWTIGRRGDVILGARLVAAAVVLINDTSPNECLRWIDAAIAAIEPDSLPTLEALLWHRKSSATRNQPASALRAAAEHALALYRKLDDPVGLANALRSLAQILGWFYRDERELADALACEALAIARTTDRTILIADCLKTRGLTIDTTDFPHKRAVLEESLALFRLYGNDRQIGNVLTWISDMEFSAGDERRALAYGRDAVRYAESAGGRALAEITQVNLAAYASALGEWATARRAALGGLQIAVESRSIAYITWAIQALAIVKIAHGDPRSGARLLGFCDARAGSIHVPRQADQCEAIAYARAIERLRTLLPADDLDAEMRRGATYPEDIAVAEARTA
jgi:diguanylate cyclase (GGDEF)-like protein